LVNEATNAGGTPPHQIFKVMILNPALLTALESLVLPALFLVAVLYAWAGICYLFLRFARPETESRMRDFLKSFRKPKKWDFFPLRFARHQPPQPPITEETMRDTSSGGWVFTGLPFITLSLGHGDWTYSNVLTSTALLFFGGSFFARGWYGRRCLRLLGVDSFNLNDDAAAR
jgi:hypothetical protein